MSMAWFFFPQCQAVMALVTFSVETENWDIQCHIILALFLSHIKCWDSQTTRRLSVPTCFIEVLLNHIQSWDRKQAASSVMQSWHCCWITFSVEKNWEAFDATLSLHYGWATSSAGTMRHSALLFSHIQCWDRQLGGHDILALFLSYIQCWDIKTSSDYRDQAVLGFRLC